MNITKSLEDKVAKFYPVVWDNEKIASRPVWAVVLISIVLSAICVGFKVLLLDSKLPPFLSFFVVVMLCVCYAGMKGALISITVTLVYSIALVIAADGKFEEFPGLSFLPILLYFVETIFFTALLHRAQITEQRCKMQYEDLLKTKNEIQERENKHEDFVHMATHELKAPVTVLKAYLQLAAMKIKSSPPSAQHQTASPINDFVQLAVKMNFQLEKLETLINDLSESSTVKSGALNYQMRVFNLVACVNDCVGGFQAAHPSATIDCRLSKSELLVSGDESRLEQVILNLLSNAVKYAKGIPKILVSCEQEGQKVFVRVKDDGLGIPTHMQPAVFDRFYRVNSPEVKKAPGLGLGLYICAEIIQQHHGEIGVESILNDGSTFWFSLPLQH